MKNKMSVAIISLLTLASLNASASVEDYFNKTKNNYDKIQEKERAESSEKRAKSIFDKAINTILLHENYIDIRHAKVERSTKVEKLDKYDKVSTKETRYIKSLMNVCKVQSEIIENTDGGMAKLMNKVIVNYSCYSLTGSEMKQGREEILLADL